MNCSLAVALSAVFVRLRSDRSAPAEKARLLPVRTMTGVVGSAVARSAATRRSR